MIEKNNLLLRVCNIAIKAGEEILKYYNDDIEVKHKDDSSPLTKADLASNKIIMNALQQLDKTIPILSEESLVEWNERKNWTKYWLVDPLDGTKEFIKKNGEFTVNIALIENNTPILGVIYTPVKFDLYFAQKNYGSYKINSSSKLLNLQEAIKIFVANQSSVKRIIGSRSHSNQSFDTWVNQNFTNNGPIAFLPISETQTSVVYSLKTKKKDYYPDIKNLIKKYNPIYSITKIYDYSSFELKSSNLRKYYKDEIANIKSIAGRLPESWQR